MFNRERPERVKKAKYLKMEGLTLCEEGLSGQLGEGLLESWRKTRKCRISRQGRVQEGRRCQQHDAAKWSREV
jgi:hypothetical protein